MYKQNTLIAVVAFASSLLSGAANASYTITDLGTLGGSGSWASGLSENGLVVGGSYVVGDSATHPFLWSAGTMVDLGTLGGRDAYATGVNSAGVIVGGSGLSIYGGCCSKGFIYSNGVMNELPGFPSNPRDTTFATAINEAGIVAGWAQAPTGLTRAATWDGQTTSNLGVLRDDWPSAISEAHAINNQGVVAGYSTTPDARAFVYQTGQMSMLDLGTLNFSIANGLNDQGEVVGQLSLGIFNNAQAFMYTNGNLLILGDGNAYDANNNGDIVGYLDQFGEGHPSGAFLFDGQDLINLSTLPEVIDAGWTNLREATAINDNGQIVGHGYISGEYHAFLMTPTQAVPEPETYAMLLAGLGLIGGMARLRKRVDASRI